MEDMEDIDKAAAVKAQGEVFEIFILADVTRFQAHGFSVTPEPLRH